MKKFTFTACLLVVSLSSLFAQTHNGHEYVDLGLPSGTLWATCNIGATTPEGYGDYFAWGETKPKTTYTGINYSHCIEYTDSLTKYCTDDTYGTVDNKTTLEAEDDAATANWGGNWRMPTMEEVKELIDTCVWNRTTMNGIYGYEITGLNGNIIFLPAAGYYENSKGDGNEMVGEFCTYWTSSLYTDGPGPKSRDAYLIYCTESGYYDINCQLRYYGLSVRPVCNNVSPDIKDESLISFEAGGIYYKFLGGDSVEVTYGSQGNGTYDYNVNGEYAGTVTIPATVDYNHTTFRVTTIGEYAFKDCSNLTAITIPNSVTTIGNCAFDCCNSLTTITLPNSVTTIGECLFRCCYSLAEVTISNGLTTIEHGMFKDCTSLTQVTIPNSITTIDTWTFYGCSDLTAITIPNSVTNIGALAFGHCSNVASIQVEAGNPTYHSANNCLIETATKILHTGCINSIIPTDGSVTTIGDFAFIECDSLTTIAIPNNITLIGDQAFCMCKKLSTITIPNSVTKIGGEAFAGCPNLTEVTIGSGVTMIDSYAFGDCSNLSKITCLAVTPPQISEDTFEEVNRSIPLYVPEASVEAYKAADHWKEFFNIQSISGSASGVETPFMRVSDETCKVLENGTLYIVKPNGEKYTIDGQKVSTM